jgi:hypothetical protein
MYAEIPADHSLKSRLQPLVLNYFLAHYCHPTQYRQDVTMCMRWVAQAALQRGPCDPSGRLQVGQRIARGDMVLKH